jgi:5-methyltetrahydropteroyltriglutamate--homocysteine methyltransferase
MSIELHSSVIQSRPLRTSARRGPFRADHVGSLLRPRALIEARERLQAGTIDPAAFRAIEDEAVLEVIGLQEDCGLQAITDGELRRNSWHMDFLYRIGGVEKGGDSLKIHFHSHAGDIEFTGAGLKVARPLTLDEPIFLDDFRFVSANTIATPKLTIPSPSMLHYRGGNSCIDPEAYADVEAFWQGLSAVYAAELEVLYAAGCRYLQLDDTSLAYLNDPAQRDHVREIGGDPERQHLVYIEAFNAAIAGRPADMTVCTHLCRGNFRSSWAASGGYDHVADALFNQLDVDGFFLEYDDERSGTFEALRFVPKGKRVVLGLVSSKTGALETKDSIRRRLDEASRFIDLDQVCLSPQCGFASTCHGNDLTVSEQAAKLKLVVDVAYDVWGVL